MADESVKISLDEAAHIVARIDEIATEEGTSRAAIIRRAIRNLVFSTPIIPKNGYDPLLGINSSVNKEQANARNAR